LERSQWKPKIHELRMRNEWEQIVGKTIARYTKSINMSQKKLTIYTEVAPLKHELQLGREQLREKINAYFGENVVEEIMVC
jgi:predicted nucleic acid-binding Zn ribbon protein